MADSESGDVWMERSFHCYAIGSKSLYRVETVDLEKEVPHSCSVLGVAFFMDTPFTK
jgi:hypothetical protein